MFNSVNKILVLLIAVFALAVIVFPVYAQNTGALPYLNSQHAYEVKVGSGSNRYWVVTDKQATEKSYTINASNSWFVISSDAVAGTQRATITFDPTVFIHSDNTHTGTWYLQYFEDQLQSDGTTICTSAREFVLNVLENTFYITVGTDASVCNGEDGKLHVFGDFYTDAGLTIPKGFDTQVGSFTVTLHKTIDYSPTSMSFDATFSQALVGGAFTAVASNNCVASVSSNTVTVYPPVTADPRVFSDNEIVVTLTATFNNPVVDNATAIQPTLSVNNGTAVKTGTPPAITQGNSTIYPVETQADHTQIVTILDIPGTKNIMPGSGETQWSAQNPRANSTHRYTVQMDDISQHTGVDMWYVTTVADPTTKLSAGYSVASSTTTTDAIAAVTFTTIAEGDYILYFVEKSVNNAACNCTCSTVRKYPFTIREPFDVDIAAVVSDCSGADQKIYDETNTAPITESTSVTYNITLNNTDYDATWQFNLQLDCSQFDGSELVATDANISVTGGSIGTIARPSGYITIPVVISKVVSTVVNKSVSVTVNYSGIYASAHDIRATLIPPASPASFGSYNEVDKDNGVVLDATESNEGTINITTHTIYAMPQAGILAGVD